MVSGTESKGSNERVHEVLSTCTTPTSTPLPSSGSAPHQHTMSSHKSKAIPASVHSFTAPTWEGKREIITGTQRHRFDRAREASSVVGPVKSRHDAQQTVPAETALGRMVHEETEGGAHLGCSLHRLLRVDWMMALTSCCCHERRGAKNGRWPDLGGRNPTEQSLGNSKLVSTPYANYLLLVISQTNSPKLLVYPL